MKRIILAATFLLLSVSASFAASEGFVVASCPSTLTSPWTAGQYGAITVDINGNQCTSGTGSGGTVTANQGTPNAGGALAWPTIDTNSAAILAAVTGPTPAGTNAIGSITNTSFGITGNATVIGPTADGTAAANPPVLTAGTVDGTGTGLVAIPKYTAAGVGYGFIVDAAGTNLSTVKAASTAPVSGDTSIVVGINPNSINSNGSATSAFSAPVVIASDQAAVAVKGGGPAAVSGAVPFTLSSQYPTNATTTTPTAVTANATGTTAAVAATLAATASVTNFVCGFTISASATSLTTGTATLSGTISGSLSYIQTVQAVASGAAILSQNFNPCIPASAANTAITITSAAAGTLGNTIVNIWGYRL
jgi:hypothetical protein